MGVRRVSGGLSCVCSGVGPCWFLSSSELSVGGVRVLVGLLFEICIVDASIFTTGTWEQVVVVSV